MDDRNTPEEQVIESTRSPGYQDDFNTIQMRLDPTPILEDIRHRLLSERFNQKTQEWCKIRFGNEMLRPKMSKVGVEELMIELYARMSVDKVLSQLEERKINEIVREVSEVVLSFLFYKYKEYQIKIADFDSITFIIKDNIDIFLRRAKGGKENLYLSKQFDYQEKAVKRFVPSGDQQSRGIGGIKWPSQ